MGDGALGSRGGQACAAASDSSEGSLSHESSRELMLRSMAVSFFVFWEGAFFLDVAVGQKKVPKWIFGKCKHGLEPAVP